jgi:fucose permease
METLKHPMVWMSLLLFFIYTGVEVSFGSWTYSLLTLARGIPTEIAGLWAGSYWATFTAGRILAGLLTRRTGVKTLLAAGSIVSYAWCGLAVVESHSNSERYCGIHYWLCTCAYLPWAGFHNRLARGRTSCCQLPSGCRSVLRGWAQH